MALAQAFLLSSTQDASEKPRGFADSAPRYRDSAEQKSRSTGNSKPARDLHEIGVILAKAVLDKNIETLLAYDREDLRAPNAESLKNNKSDLYCYIFDSDCITWGDGSWRSVYEKLSQAQKLEITVKLTSSPYDRQTYGSLFFYDASSVSGKDLRSRDFLCKEGPAKIASWKFRLEHGKWKAVTPLFDSETRAGCPADTEEKE
jgi:hypothetical protein